MKAKRQKLTEREKEILNRMFPKDEFCTCEGVQDLIAMTGICRKCNKQVTY